MRNLVFFEIFALVVKFLLSTFPMPDITDLVAYTHVMMSLFLYAGGITIAWVNEGNDGQPQILHIQPFTAKDFSTRSLSDRIRDFDDLYYLFPNKPKHEAFDRYTTPVGPPRNKNYIASEVRAVLMPGPNNNPMNSYPNTPSYNIQSPDASRDTPSSG